MTIGSAAYLEVQWIDMVFNTSEPITGIKQVERRGASSKCRTVCRVDGVKNVGFPEVLYRSSSSTSTMNWSTMLLGICSSVAALIYL